MRLPPRSIAFFIVVSSLSMPCATAEQRTAEQRTKLSSSSQTSPARQINIAGAVFEIGDNASVQVSRIHADLESVPSNGPCKQRLVHIQSGQIALTTASVTALLNNKFLKKKSGTHDVKLTTDDGKVKLEGKSGKGIPFTWTAKLGTTQDGKVQLKTDGIKVAKVPAKGLFELFGVELDDLVKPKSRKIEIVKDTVLLDPAQLGTDPALRGFVSAVQIRGQTVIFTFGAPQQRTQRAPVKVAKPGSK